MSRSLCTSCVPWWKENEIVVDFERGLLGRSVVVSARVRVRDRSIFAVLVEYLLGFRQENFEIDAPLLELEINKCLFIFGRMSHQSARYKANNSILVGEY